MLNLLLLLGIIILVLPWPLKKTLRRLYPVIGLAVAVILTILVVDVLTAENGNSVVIEALNKKNAASGGEEVWLTEALVNGEKIDLVAAFGDSWIEEDGSLIWRPYDQKTGMTESISAHFEAGDAVELKFQSNQWRGMAKISCADKQETLDFYSNTDTKASQVSWKTVVPEAQKGKIHLSPKDVVVIVVAVLVLLSLICCAISAARKKGSQIKQGEDDTRYVWIDALKVLSAFMVVVIHSSGSVYNNAFGQDMSLWMKALWMNAIPRFAVPCFLLITGALLLGKSYDYDKALWKKIKRILIPLIFWGIMYVVTRKLLWHGSENVAEEILKIPFKHQDSSLWYAYQLFWIYLGLPVWQKLYKALSSRMKWGFIGFSLVIPGALTMLGELMPFDVPEYLPFGSICPIICYVGILFLGKMIVEAFAQQKIRMWVTEGMLLIAIGLGSMVLCSVYTGNMKGASVHTYFSEARLPGVCYGAGVFILFCCMKNFFQRLPYMLKHIINEVSKVSLGIYFSHCLITWIFPDMTIGGVWIARDSGSLKQLLACICVYYIISLTGCLAASKIPGLKRFVL